MHNWLIQIDADEFIDINPQQLKKLITSRYVAVYVFKWMLYRKNKLIFTGYKPVLLNRNRTSYIASIHQEVAPLHKYKCVKTNYSLYHKANYDHVNLKQSWRKYFNWAKRNAQEYLTSFEQIEKYNYVSNKWPKYTRLRIKHPILFGLIITPIFTLILGFKTAIIAKSMTPLFMGMVGVFYWIVTSVLFIKGSLLKKWNKYIGDAIKSTEKYDYFLSTAKIF